MGKELRAAKLMSFDDTESFRARAGSFLLAHEAEHNLIYGILSGIEGERYRQRRLWVLERDGDVVAAALCTPPHNLVLSLTDENAARALADALADDGAALPGVVAASTVAAAFASRWSERTGATVEQAMAERIYALSSVRPPSGVPGRARPARHDDLDLVVAWLDAFNTEAHADDHVSTEAELRDRAAWMIGGEPRLVLLWEHDGEVVSLAGSSGPTPNGIRVGPVYTPPDKRARGYASACVAELSRRRLADGYRFCFLFTDLENPVSNSIYQRIGYEPVCDVDVYRFR